jgi:sec-independent protein translocase protein TatC
MTSYTKPYEEEGEEQEEGGMSFLEHLDELRSRLIRIVIFVMIAFIACWIFSYQIYDFLQVPVQAALANAKRVTAVELKGIESSKISEFADGEKVEVLIRPNSRVGATVIPAGISLFAKVQRDEAGNVELVTSENVVVNDQTVIKSGYVIPQDLYSSSSSVLGPEDKLVTGTVQGGFNLYIKVAFYGAIFFSVPFLLIQVWGFISPGLYDNEKKYAIPFVFMSTLFFLLGCTFAYYIAFPRAADFLLEVAVQGNLRPLVSADEYFDLILLIMLGLGLVFEMPTVTYFLARLGIVTPKFLIKGWRFAIVIIFIVAAVLSPTTDIPNLLVFAAPMIILYAVSIGIAWVFYKKRQQSSMAES